MYLFMIAYKLNSYLIKTVVPFKNILWSPVCPNYSFLCFLFTGNISYGACINGDQVWIQTTIIGNDYW